ncbi:MAG: hypothetical protein IKZ74_04500 [Clostridiales bacterium]|nr:hypothetical protein [Clostridiales bacterium]
MTWQDFFDNCSEWADSTVKSRISSLKEMGPVNEVIEASEYISEECGNALIRKALALGVVFRPDDIAKLSENGPQDEIPNLIKIALKNKFRFSKDNIEMLYECLPFENEQLLRDIDKKQNIGYFKELDGEDEEDDEFDDDDDSYDYADTSGRKPGLLEKLGLFFLVSEADKKRRQMKQERRERSGGAFSSVTSRESRYHIGERVRLRSNRQEGYIVDVHDGRYDVRLDDGSYHDFLSESQIERTLF